MNGPLVLAGVLALLGAAVHGGVGQVYVVRSLVATGLPPTRLGGPRMTAAMVQVSWHIVTAAFAGLGVALILAGTALDGDSAEAVAVTGACAATAFAAVMLVLGVTTSGSTRSLIRHPGPLAFALTAALAWWGAL